MCKSLLSSEYSDSVRPLYPQPGQPYVHRSFQIWHRIRQWSGYVLTANHGIAHTCVCFSTEYCLNRPPQDCRRGEGSQMPFNMLTFFAERRIHHNSVIDRCCFSRQQIVSDHIVLFQLQDLAKSVIRSMQSTWSVTSFAASAMLPIPASGSSTRLSLRTPASATSSFASSGA